MRILIRQCCATICLALPIVLSPAAAFSFSITNLSIVDNDVRIAVGYTDPAKTYRVIAADNNASRPPVSIHTTTNPPGNGFVFLDSGVLADGSIETRYYQVVEMGGASVLTNREFWLVQKQERAQNRWHMASTPVSFGPPGENRLDASLGDQLASGLVGGTTDMTAPGVWLWQTAEETWTNFWLHADGDWYAGATIADYCVDPGVGYWVKTSTSGPAAGTALYAGREHTNATDILFVTNRWTLFAWPFARRRAESDGAAGEQGWCFQAAGAHGAPAATTSDRIYMECEGDTYMLALGTNGRWTIQNTTTYPDVFFENGNAYYYYASGTSFVWRATEVAPPAPASDVDSLPDDWEQQWFGNLLQGDSGDPDGDGVINLDEYFSGTDPTLANLEDVNDVTGFVVYTPLN